MNNISSAATEFRRDASRNAQPEAPPLPPLRIIRPEDHYSKIIPHREWIIPHWIPCGVVTSLYGDGGVGKSLIAQQLQSSAALGGEWLGLAVEPVRSIGFYCEDDGDELLRRQATINAAYGLAASDLQAVRMVSRIGDDNLLILFDKSGRGELTPFWKQCVDQVQDEKAKLVIFDTASDTFAGNENDRGQVKQFVARALGSIATKIGGAVILSCHPSRSGMASGDGDGGSTGWNAAVRSRLYFTTPKPDDGEAPDHDARVLKRQKANYAARNDEIRVRWRNGVFVPDQIESDGYRPPIDDVFLCLLDQRNAQGRPVSPKPRASTFAPKVFGAMPKGERHGYTRSQFETALDRLFAAGRIKIDTFKTVGRNVVERIIREGE
jgi:RecA-family ATPase